SAPPKKPNCAPWSKTCSGRCSAARSFCSIIRIMPGPGLTRRNFVKKSAALANLLPLAVAGSGSGPARKLKVVCVGAHPDDPESGCAGTLVQYADAGHAVTIVYLTRGERGISGKSLDETARIRTAECENACRILGARPAYAG